MPMTKADFQEIADAMEEAKRRVIHDHNYDSAEIAVSMSALESAVTELATACARRYKGGYGFNRQRFVTACGFPDA